MEHGSLIKLMALLNGPAIKPDTLLSGKLFNACVSKVIDHGLKHLDSIAKDVSFELDETVTGTDILRSIRIHAGHTFFTRRFTPHQMEKYGYTSISTDEVFRIYQWLLGGSRVNTKPWITETAERAYHWYMHDRIIKQLSEDYLIKHQNMFTAIWGYCVANDLIRLPLTGYLALE